MHIKRKLLKYLKKNEISPLVKNQVEKEDKRSAFTLAEVLITIGIIGIVAAMTLPALIQNYKYKVLETQFKKAYSDLNQASKNFQIHNGLTVSAYAASDYSGAFKLFQKEFKSITHNSSLKWNSTDEEGNSIGAAPYKWYTIKGQTASANCDVSGFFWDGTGRVIAFDDKPSSGDNGPKVCIDINGQKMPNKYGIDYFIFMFTTDGYVIPWGQEHKNNPASSDLYGNGTVSKTYCSISNYVNQQYACAIYALSNTHPKEDGKDYWHDFVKGW